METPDYVFKHGGTSGDWNPKHDILKLNNRHLQRFSQESFWLTNYKIRKAVTKVNSEIDDHYSSESIDPFPYLTYKGLARQATVSKGSLFHEARCVWVKDTIDEINRKIEGFSESKTDTIGIQLKEQLNEALRRLVLQRNETQNWFGKYQELKVHLKEQERIIENLELSLKKLKNNRSENGNLAVS